MIAKSSLKANTVFILLFYLIVVTANFVLVRPISAIKNIFGLMNSFPKKNGRQDVPRFLYLHEMFLIRITKNFLSLFKNPSGPKLSIMLRLNPMGNIWKKRRVSESPIICKIPRIVFGVGPELI